MARSLGKLLMKLLPIHPFPARMAPELVLDELANLPEGATVLDPMTGSGTVLRASVERGLVCAGFDMDPLAVLMARVWTTKLPDGLEETARKIAEAATRLTASDLPTHITASEQTKAFADFWFEEKQQTELSALVSLVEEADEAYRDPLRLALSRLIITKENGASIARDTSHSRPHRVFFNNKFSVLNSFAIAARRIEQRHRSDLVTGTATVAQGDARRLPTGNATYDAVITSPPYLNAIDYMRGHRLALIWLGYGLEELRTVRSTSIGAESGQPLSALELGEAVPEWAQLPARHQMMINRYANDISALMVEIRRVLKPSGSALLVVGDSTLNGTYISNAMINVLAAKAAGMSLAARFERDLPTASRYLPVGVGDSSLGKRMRTETVLRFAA